MKMLRDAQLIELLATAWAKGVKEGQNVRFMTSEQAAKYIKPYIEELVKSV